MSEATFRSTVRPSSGFKSLCTKLARHFSRHWFKHATQRDLMEEKIYVMVRNKIATSLRLKMKAFFEEVALDRNKPRSLRPISISRATVIVSL